MRSLRIFTDEASEGFLLVDASDAFNSLNRAVTLQNIQYTCPASSTILINTYHCPAPLYVDGDAIYSNEGTTQGDPLAMPFYTLSTIPLIRKLPTVLFTLGMLMMQVPVERSLTCVCGGINSQQLDHLMAIFLMLLKHGLLSKTVI